MLRIWSAIAILCLNNACRDIPPAIEICAIGDAGCICSDPRLEPDTIPGGAYPVEGKPGVYIRTFQDCKNYVATGASDYQRTQEWIVNKCRM